MHRGQTSNGRLNAACLVYLKCMTKFEDLSSSQQTIRKLKIPEKMSVFLFLLRMAFSNKNILTMQYFPTTDTIQLQLTFPI